MTSQSKINLFERDRAASAPCLHLAARLCREALGTPITRHVVRTMRGLVETASGRGASRSLQDIDGWSHHAQVASCEERWGLWA